MERRPPACIRSADVSSALWIAGVSPAGVKLRRWNTRTGRPRPRMQAGGLRFIETYGASEGRPKLRFFYDVTFQAGNECECFVFFFLRNFEFIERGNEMLDRRLPVGFADSQSLVGGFHVAANVLAGTACGSAKLINDQLPDARQRVG